MKRRSVIYTAEAASDLEWIYDLIADAGSPLTASRYERRIRAICDGLEDASERGHRRDDIRPGLRVIGFERRVTIAVAVETEQLVILRIFYGGRDWERDMR